MHRRLQSGEVLVADLSEVSLAGASGVIWGLDSPQLNANLVKLDADNVIDDHVNTDLDVLLVVQAGDGSVTIDGRVHDVAADSVVLIPAGTSRSIRARRRLLYFSIHHRREGLAINAT